MEKRKSISRRMYRAILAVSALSMAVMVTTTLVVNEDLEDTMLQIEYRNERDFIMSRSVPGEVLLWDSPSVAIVFVPSGMALPAHMPEMLRGMSSGKFSGEIERDGRTWLTSVEPGPAGTLYMAKDITHFEKRELLFEIALAVMAAIILALSLLLAVLGSRRIVTPLTRLAQQISRVPVGAKMPHIENDYEDAELHSIASTFNRFLDELEAYVRREQSLLGLASHELRTPIAVVSGALDIIESRGKLGESDRATLARIRRACTEMRDNVDVLLKLSRRDGGEGVREQIDLDEVARRVIRDLSVSHGAGDRVTLFSPGGIGAWADPTLAAMLLRNLIQNAVQHTRGDITVTLAPGRIEVADSGEGLSERQQAILGGREAPKLESFAFGGLGLYIVTLACERLGWRLETGRSAEGGALIRVLTG